MYDEIIVIENSDNTTTVSMFEENILMNTVECDTIKVRHLRKSKNTIIFTCAVKNNEVIMNDKYFSVQTKNLIVNNLYDTIVYENL